MAEMNKLLLVMMIIFGIGFVGITGIFAYNMDHLPEEMVKLQTRLDVTKEELQEERERSKKLNDALLSTKNQLNEKTFLLNEAESFIDSLDLDAEIGEEI